MPDALSWPLNSSITDKYCITAQLLQMPTKKKQDTHSGKKKKKKKALYLCKLQIVLFGKIVTVFMFPLFHPGRKTNIGYAL